MREAEEGTRCNCRSQSRGNMSVRTAWGQMISGCFDPAHPKYPRYGGRGIRVCDRWLIMKYFIEDMGPRPHGMTISRIDNDGDYCPENCEWATTWQQALNRSDNRKLTHKGETKCLAEWARTTGIKRETISRRLQRGWPLDKALTHDPSESNTNARFHDENSYVR